MVFFFFVIYYNFQYQTPHGMSVACSSTEALVKVLCGKKHDNSSVFISQVPIVNEDLSAVVSAIRQTGVAALQLFNCELDIMAAIQIVSAVACARSPISLNLSNNNISTSVKTAREWNTFLCCVVKAHERLTRLDLSNNFISEIDISLLKTVTSNLRDNYKRGLHPDNTICVDMRPQSCCPVVALDTRISAPSHPDDEVTILSPTARNSSPTSQFRSPCIVATPRARLPSPIRNRRTNLNILNISPNSKSSNQRQLHIRSENTTIDNSQFSTLQRVREVGSEDFFKTPQELTYASSPQSNSENRSITGTGSTLSLTGPTTGGSISRMNFLEGRKQVAVKEEIKPARALSANFYQKPVPLQPSQRRSKSSEQIPPKRTNTRSHISERRSSSNIYSGNDINWITPPKSKQLDSELGLSVRIKQQGETLGHRTSGGKTLVSVVAGREFEIVLQNKRADDAFACKIQLGKTGLGSVYMLMPQSHHRVLTRGKGGPQLQLPTSETIWGGVVAKKPVSLIVRFHLATPRDSGWNYHQNVYHSESLILTSDLKPAAQFSYKSLTRSQSSYAAPIRRASDASNRRRIRTHSAPHQAVRGISFTSKSTVFTRKLLAV